MLDFLKKKQCSNCGKTSRKIVVNYAGYDICSEECMIEFFSKFDTKELITLDIKDREVNKDFYNWIYKIDNPFDKVTKFIIFILVLCVIKNIIDRNLIGLLVSLIAIYCNYKGLTR